jgi:hypothetical protein
VEIRIPLNAFVQRLAEVKNSSHHWPHLDETEWLVTNFCFDDDFAHYNPQPEEPYKALMFQLARN